MRSTGKSKINPFAGEVTVEVISWAARSYDLPVITESARFSLPPLASKVVMTLPLKASLTESGLTLLDAVVRLRSSAKGNPQGMLSALLLLLIHQASFEGALIAVCCDLVVGYGSKNLLCRANSANVFCGCQEPIHVNLYACNGRSTCGWPQSAQ